MADDAGAPAGESSDQGSESQNEVVNSIPGEWAENDSYKDFFQEDGSFDFERFSETHEGMKALSPDVPDEYSFEFPENNLLDETDIQLQRDMAKDAGLTQSQYEQIVKFDMARLSREADAITAEAEGAKAELIKEWGGEQKFKANLAAAAKVAATIFGEDFAERADLGNDTQLIKGLFAIHKNLSEDNFKQGSSVNSDNRKIGVDGEMLFNYGNSG